MDGAESCLTLFVRRSKQSLSSESRAVQLPFCAIQDFYCRDWTVFVAKGVLVVVPFGLSHFCVLALWCLAGICLDHRFVNWRGLQSRFSFDDPLI